MKKKTYLIASKWKGETMKKEDENKEEKEVRTSDEKSLVGETTDNESGTPENGSEPVSENVSSESGDGTSSEVKEPVSENNEPSNDSKEDSEEVKALKEEIERLKGKKKSRIGKYIKACVAIVLCCVATMLVSICIMNKLDYNKLRKNVASNDIYTNLELADESDKEEFDEIFDGYYETVSENTIYAEAQDSYGSYYSICYSNNNESVYSDDSTFAYFIDKNNGTYSICADSDGYFVEGTMTQFDPIRFANIVKDSDKAEIYKYIDSDTTNNLYFSFKDTDFEKVIKAYGLSEYNYEFTIQSFKDYVGLGNNDLGETYNVIIGIGAYEDGAIIDFIVVNPDAYKVAYEVEYFETLGDWNFGDDWYDTSITGDDRVSLASDIVVELSGLKEVLYEKYNTEDEDSSSDGDESDESDASEEDGSSSDGEVETISENSVE